MIDVRDRPKQRSRFTRAVQACKKPASMLAVVGTAMTLSVSLVATTPSNAEAFVLPVTPALPAVFGATEMALPEVMATGAMLGPLGWGLVALTGAAVLGVAAYETRDTWGPWLAGQFGGGDPSKPAPTPAAGNNARALQGLQLSNVTQKDAQTLTTALTWNAPSGSVLNAHYAYIHQCQYPQAYGVGDANGLFTVTNVGQARNVSAPVNANLDFTCHVNKGGADLYGTPVALRVGLAGTDGLPNLPTDGSAPTSGPTNEVSYGTLESGQFDPHGHNVKYTTTVECIAPDGSKANISRDWYGDSPGMVIPSCAAAGLGHGTGGMNVTGVRPDTGDTVNLLTRAPAGPDTAHPLCGPSIAGPGCKLQVLVDGKPCVIGDWTCVNWIRIDPNRVQCFYGPYQVALTECNELKRAYEPVPVPITPPNIDPTPGDGSDTNLDGKPQPQPQPGPGPGTTPGGAGAPGPAGTPSAQPNPTDTSGDCFPQGWGVFNPVEWIQKPVGCALSWAFVPKGTTMTQLETQVKTDVDRVGFGPIQAAVVGMFTPLGASGAGCTGPPVTFNMHGQTDTFYPFQACTAPMSIAASVCNALTTMIFIIGGGMGLLRAISAAFGYNFSFGRGSAE